MQLESCADNRKTQNDMCKNSGFRSRIQKSYKKFGIESKNLIIFSESIPNLLPPPLLPWAHTDRTDLTGFLCGWEISRMLCSFASKGSRRFREIQQEDYLWEFVLIRGKKSSQQNISVIRGICGFKANPQIFMGHFRVQSRDFRRNPCRFRGF